MSRESREYRENHPVLASVFDVASAITLVVATVYLIVGCAQGAAWLIGQVV